MNIIAFYEFDPEDLDQILEKTIELDAEREKGTEKYPKILFPSQGMGRGWKGFVIYDDPTPEQLTNVMLLYKELMNYEFVPIVDSRKFMEAYQKMKK